MAGETQRVTAGPQWTRLISAESRDSLVLIEAYGGIEMSVAEGEAPGPSVLRGHAINGPAYLRIQGRDIIWVRGAGIVVCATALKFIANFSAGDGSGGTNPIEPVPLTATDANGNIVTVTDADGNPVMLYEVIDGIADETARMMAEIADGKATVAISQSGAAAAAAAAAEGRAVDAQRAIGPTPMEFGAVGDGIANDTAAVQAWLNAGRNLRMVGRYAITGPVTASVAGTRVTGDGSLIWRGALRVEAGVIVSGAGSSVDGIELDGRDLLGKGIHITGNNCPVRKCHIHNMRSETQTAVGIYATSLVGAEISGNHIHHIHSVGDATGGNANGASRAVLIQTAAALTKAYDITENDIHEITGEEGDGIQILTLAGATFLSAAKTRIARNRIRQSNKRCIKVQAHDVQVEGNIARLDVDGAYSAIDVINSSRVTVRNNDVTVTAVDGRGIQYASFDPGTFGRCADGVVEGNRVVTPAGSAHLGIYALLTDRPNISGNTVTGGRIVVDDCLTPVTDGNNGIEMPLSGSDGLVSIRSNCVAATARDNILHSGGAYTCVRVDAPGTVAANNRNLTPEHNAASAVYVTSSGNVLTGNVNAKPAVPVIRYSAGTSEAAQVSAVGNVTA